MCTGHAVHITGIFAMKVTYRYVVYMNKWRGSVRTWRFSVFRFLFRPEPDYDRWVLGVTYRLGRAGVFCFASRFVIGAMRYGDSVWGRVCRESEGSSRRSAGWVRGPIEAVKHEEGETRNRSTTTKGMLVGRVSGEGRWKSNPVRSCCPVYPLPPLLLHFVLLSFTRWCRFLILPMKAWGVYGKGRRWDSSRMVGVLSVCSSVLLRLALFVVGFPLLCRFYYVKC